MNTKLTTVTPEMAKRFLKTNECNRPVRMAHVMRLKNEILAGRWLPTHQGIAFADDGSLLDGQHRLMAIEASGREVKMFVTHGVKKFHNGDINLNAMDVIDCGKSRTTADQLHLLHGVSNSSLTVAACKIISIACCGDAKWARTLSVGQAMQILEIYGDAIALLIGMVQGSPLARKSAIIGALALASQVDTKVTVKFMEELRTGSGIKEGDPVYALRESLITAPTGNSEKYRQALVERTLNCVFNTINGTPIKLAKIGSQGIEYILSKQKVNVEKVKSIMNPK